jgi:hypothetical protein
LTITYRSLRLYAQGPQAMLWDDEDFDETAYANSERGKQENPGPPGSEPDEPAGCKACLGSLPTPTTTRGMVIRRESFENDPPFGNVAMSVVVAIGRPRYPVGVVTVAWRVDRRARVIQPGATAESRRKSSRSCR